MGVGWTHSQKQRGTDYRDHISGRWRVNVFFFLLIGVHSLVLPWLPSILQGSGFSYYGMGMVMAAVVTAGLISVKLCILFVTATRSGALRRFILFIFLISSLAMYVVAIGLLPRHLIYNECTRSVTTTSEVFINKLSTESVNNPKPTSTGTHRPSNIPIFESSSSASQLSTESSSFFTSTIDNSAEVSEEHLEMLISTVSTPKRTTTTHSPTIVIASSSSSSPSLSSSSSSSSSSSAAAAVASSSTTLSSSSPTSSPSRHVLPSSTTTATAIVAPVSRKPPSIITNSPLANLTIAGSLSSLGVSPSTPTHKHPSHRHPPHTATSSHHSSHHSHFLESKTNSSTSPFSTTGVSTSNASVVRPSLITKLPYLNRNNSRRPFHSTFPFHPHTRKKHPLSIQRFRTGNISTLNTPSIRPWAGNSRRANINQIYKREIAHEQNIETNPHSITTTSQTFDLNLEDIKKMKEDLINAGMKEREKIVFDVPTSHTWIWVSILLVSAALLGGGIEASVTRLWHCYSHGYHLFHGRARHDGDDLLERTLTDTFELSATGEHYGWTRVLASGVVMAAALLLAFGCQIGLPPGWSLLGQAGMFTIGGIFTIGSLLLVVPIPWGSIRPPKTSRPLSLYLDDEVLWEGLRRIACPAGATIHGLLCALPTLYVVPILDTMTKETKFSSAIVIIGVASCLAGDGAAMCFRRRLTTLLDSPALVGVALAGLSLQMLLTWAVSHGPVLWFVAMTWLVVGASQAFVAISVRQNALMLATIRDQEREAWVSWCCGRGGCAVGAALWPVLAQYHWGTDDGLHRLLAPASATAAAVAVLVALMALLTRTRRAARRRVYHTLDLHSCADDEETSDEEEDWLVRGARKEGLVL